MKKKEIFTKIQKFYEEKRGTILFQNKIVLLKMT